LRDCLIVRSPVQRRNLVMLDPPAPLFASSALFKVGVEICGHVRGGMGSSCPGSICIPSVVERAIIVSPLVLPIFSCGSFWGSWGLFVGRDLLAGGVIGPSLGSSADLGFSARIIGEAS